MPAPPRDGAQGAGAGAHPAEPGDPVRDLHSDTGGDRRDPAHGFRGVVHEERHRGVREALMLADIVDVPEARYRALLDYEREAAARGYPALA